METQLTEYKALWKDEYLKWVCGFANAQGGVLSVAGESHESDTNVVDNVTMNVVDKLSERQKDIIKILLDSVVDNVVENATTLSHRLGVSHRTIQRDLEYLKKLNVIRRVGTDRGGHWEVISKWNQ